MQKKYEFGNKEYQLYMLQTLNEALNKEVHKLKQENNIKEKWENDKGRED